MCPCRARLNETLARLERVVTALVEGKENVGPEAATETIGKTESEQTLHSQSLSFQKQVAENLLGSRLL